MDDQPVESTSAPSPRGLFVRGVAGALIGAAVGYWLYFVLLRRGYLILPLPGACIGFGRELAARFRSLWLAIFCFVLALAVQGYIVHRTFATGLLALEGLFLAAFIVGLVFAFWFGLGRNTPATGAPKE